MHLNAFQANRLIVSVLCVFFSLSLAAGLSCAESMEIIQRGISGAITSDIGTGSLSDQDAGEHVFLGTQLGAYIFTSSGELLNFIQTGSSVTNIRQVPDINGNGFDEIVLTTNNAYFPNLLCFDPKTGEELWDFSSQTEVYDMNMLWTMKQVSAFDLEASGDRVYLTAGYFVYCLDSRNGDVIWSYEGTDNMWDIALTGGDVIAGDQNGYVYRIDGASGDVLWKSYVSESYDVINPSTKQNMGTVKRSVWDIIPVVSGDKTLLTASCEDGYLHILDAGTGEIQDSIEIIDYVDDLLYAYYGDYPIPTSIVDYNFQNIRAEPLPDMSGDGVPDVMVYTYPGTRQGSGYQGAQSAVHVIDPVTGSEMFSTQNIDLSRSISIGTLTVSYLGHNNYMLLPAGKSGSVEKVRVLMTKDGSNVKTISINSSSGGTRTNSYVIKDLGNDNFIMASDYGDIIKSDYQGRVEWSYPRLNNIRVERADMVGSEQEDLFIYSLEGSQENGISAITSSRTMFVIDGETRNTAWSYEMPYDEFIKSGGLKEIKIMPDVNSDGKSDIVCYKQRPAEWGSGDEFGEYTSIVMFSGNGNILWERPLTNNTYYGVYERISRYPQYLENMLAMQWGFSEESTVLSVPVDDRTEFRKQLMELEDRLEQEEENHKIRKIITSLDTVEDVNGDGIQDLVAGSWNDVYIVDSVTGDIAWNRTYNDWGYQDPFGKNPMEGMIWDWVTDDRVRYISLDDSNSDGYSELVQVSWNGMNLLRSNLSTGRLDYTPYREISPEEGNLDRERSKRIDDVNNDGISDIMFSIYIEDSSPLYRIISGKDGSDMMDMEMDGTSVSFAAGDLNSDGRVDSIAFHKYGNSGPYLEVISGSSRNAMWSYHEYEETWMLEDFFGISEIMPACTVSDMNGDGAEDLVIGRSLPWDSGAEIIVFDIKNDKTISKMDIEQRDPMNTGELRWQPAVVTSRLSDLTGDGKDEIATIMALGEGDQKQLRLVVVDIDAGEIISDFTARGTNIERLGDMIATYGSGGELYILDPGRDISITSPADRDLHPSPVRIEWEGAEDSVKIVMVDGMSVMKTSGHDAEFDIREGERKITVYSFDTNGKGVYDSVDVVIEKGSAAQGPLTLVVALLLGILFLPALLSRFLKSGLSGLLPFGSRNQPESETKKEVARK